LAKLWQKIKWHLFSGHGVDAIYYSLAESTSITIITTFVKFNKARVRGAGVARWGT